MTDVLARQGVPWRAITRPLRAGAAVIGRNPAATGSVAPTASASLAFLLAGNLLGPFNPGLTQVLLTIALVVFALPVWRSTRGSARLLAAVALLPAAVTPFCHDDGQAARLAMSAIAVATAAAGYPERLRPAARAATVMFAGGALVYLGAQHLDPVWQALDDLAAIISAAASTVAGTELRLGPIATGLWPALLGIALSLAALRHRPGRAVLNLLLVATVVTLHAAFASTLERGIAAAAQRLLATAPAFYNDLDQPNRIVPGGLTGLSSLVVLAAVILLARFSGIIVPTVPARRAVRRAPLAAAALVMIAAGVALATAHRVPPPAPGRTIAFYDVDLDLSKPLAGRYGLIQAGMYGSMWDLLERAGYHCLRLSDDQLAAPDALKDVAALVVIMPRKIFAPEAHAAIWRFVERGGGLLALGDHTDLWGIMAPLNSLLAPVGVSFAFDSAFPVRRHWQYALNLRPHVLSAGIPDQVDIQIGTGASLRLAGGLAAPVIVGRYAFGDYGNRLNVGQGGLLGDYRYQAGEQLGDLPLVAAAQHGAGRVVVFGDTSTFQVLAVPLSATMVERVLRWLAQPPATRDGRLGLFVGLALLVLALLAALMLFPDAPAMVAAAAAGAAAHGFVPAAGLPPLSPAKAIAVVDFGGIPRFSYEFFADDSYGGVFTALSRAGYLPLSDLRTGPALLRQAGFAAYVTPTVAPDAAHRREIAALLARGGTLLVADGRRDPVAANAVLAACGLRIEPVPLGPAHVDWGSETVDFFDAWPVTAAPGQGMTVHAQWKGFAVIAETRVGPGRCLAVGDGRWLTDKTFEGEFQYHPVNLRFVDRLLQSEPPP